MAAKKDVYRIAVLNLTPRWAIRLLTGTYKTAAEAEAARVKFRDQARTIGYRPTYTVIPPEQTRAAVIEARSKNLTRVLREMRSPVATDFDDAVPRLHKLARYAETLRERNDHALNAPYAGDLLTVRKGSLGTEAGLAFLHTFWQHVAEIDRYEDYRYTAEESAEIRQATYGETVRDEVLTRMRRELDELVQTFVASTIHADEL